jgi:hypothetical protein
MKELHLRYVAVVLPITGRLNEEYVTSAATLKELILELDEKYGGFEEMFINSETGKQNLNTLIYYGDKGKIPIAVLDIDQPVLTGAKITFW